MVKNLLYMKYIKLLFLGFLLIGLYSCERSDEIQSTQKKQKEIITQIYHTDDYGCKVSVGYQWSLLKNKCIFVAVSGIRLDPQDPGIDPTSNAFVIISDKASYQAEVFLPGVQKSLLLTQIESQENQKIWVAGNLKLKHWRGIYFLDKNNKNIYRGPAIR